VVCALPSYRPAGTQQRWCRIPSPKLEGRIFTCFFLNGARPSFPAAMSQQPSGPCFFHTAAPSTSRQRVACLTPGDVVVQIQWPGYLMAVHGGMDQEVGGADYLKAVHSGPVPGSPT
jgi:hypothetical protein